MAAQVTTMTSVAQDNDQSQNEQVIPPILLMVSGCKDIQTSAEVQNVASFELPPEAGSGGAGGACTTSLIATLEDEDCPEQISLGVLLQRMRAWLEQKKSTQVPQLSSSRELDFRCPFELLSSPVDSVYSAKPGTAKALLIGINYLGQRGQLNGCHKDVEMVKRLLLGRGYQPDGMRILLDDGSHMPPTRANILQGFEWCLEGAETGCARFLHYSGHGFRIREEGADEKDGLHETLVPVDHKVVGLIRDDEVSQKLVMALPRGTRLTCIMDCCHSGTILDLPYKVKVDERNARKLEAGTLTTLTANPCFNLEKAVAMADAAMANCRDMDEGQRGGSCQSLLKCLFGKGQQLQQQKKQGQQHPRPLDKE